MEQEARIKINLLTKEVEWQGSENFIQKFDTVIQEFLEKLKDPQTSKYSVPEYNDAVQSDEVDIESSNGLSLPSTFGEFYSKFPRNIKVVDKLLIAAFFAQNKSDDGFFTPKEAADFLTEQGVAVTNANAFINSLQKTNKLFKHAGKYKVHENAIEYIKQLYQK